MVEAISMGEISRYRLGNWKDIFGALGLLMTIQFVDGNYSQSSRTNGLKTLQFKETVLCWTLGEWTWPFEREGFWRYTTMRAGSRWVWDTDSPVWKRISQNSWEYMLPLPVYYLTCAIFLASHLKNILSSMLRDRWVGEVYILRL